MKTVALALLALLFTGCGSTTHAPLPTVAHVDLNRYLGTWYEIARFEQSFQKGCTDVTATYSLKTNGDINVLNRCATATNPDKSAQGVAYATDETNSKLKVSFFRPFYGNYWIIDLDEAYTYAVIGEPKREYLWILSRTTTLPKETLEAILQKLSNLGFDTSKLLYTSHR